MKTSAELLRENGIDCDQAPAGNINIFTLGASAGRLYGILGDRIVSYSQSGDRYGLPELDKGRPIYHVIEVEETATTTGHTPGPWTWEKKENYPTTNLYGPNPKDGHDYILSIYESHGGGDMPNDANAALIAAAPELKEFIEDCLEFGKAAELFAFVRDNAPDVIAKAEGEG